MPNDASTVWWDEPPITGRQICSGNVDWYATYIESAQTLVVDLTFSHAAGDLDVRLYDSTVTPETLQQHQLAQAISLRF